ncbi:uncharacterized protein LOC111628576 [Centruroides sculpturatus]|uniref:uncharacterized protein LOC111628576 n=1 Tax=Centruroides sculpturatus TaxID=218467 RepID=UPI000C6CE51B|nr:uncharacterized protein LOC111628576 [Centruroides sculpturatus]
MKNRAYHEGIKRFPYEAIFGCPIKMGLAASAIPGDMVKVIRSEEDLEKLFHLHDNTEQNNDIENEIEQDKEESIVENESEGNIDNSTVNDKTQEDEMIITEMMKAKQITDDSNVTIQKSVVNIRNNAKLSLEKQAEKMKAMSVDKYRNMKIGQNGRLKVPEIDKIKTDPKSIIAVVIDVKDNEFYQLGTKIGVLKQLYTQSQFTSCPEDFIKIEVVIGKEVSLREVVAKLSLTGGQGFKKCNCFKKCLTKKCACKSSGLLCNSKCHDSSPCCNK